MKNKRFFGLAALLALSLVLSGALWGQTAPETLRESPTSIATNQWFTSAADDYINPAEYSGVEFDNFFSFVSLAEPGAALKGALGFATRFGGLYLGLYYDGDNAIGNTKTFTETPVNWDGTDYKDIPVFAATPSLTGFDNRLAVLVGVADMGFRLTIRSTYDEYKGSDVRIGGTNYYADYYTGAGDIVPQIAWAMAKPLLEQGIKPQAFFELRFDNNFARGTSYTDVGGPTVTKGEETIYSAGNFIEPVIGLGLGGFDFYANNGLTMGVDLNYLLSFKLYDNDYNYTDSSGDNKIASGLKGTYATGGAMTEITEIWNTFDPSFHISFDAGDGLAFAAGLDLGLQLNSSTSTQMILKPASTNGDLVKEGTDTSTDIFRIIPKISVGLRFAAIADVLTLNIGGTISPSSVTFTTAETARYVNDVKQTDAQGPTTAKTTAFSAGNDTTLSLGLTFNFTPGIALEAVTNVTTANGINIFTATANNIAVFNAIMVTAKF